MENNLICVLPVVHGKTTFHKKYFWFIDIDSIYDTAEHIGQGRVPVDKRRNTPVSSTTRINDLIQFIEINSITNCVIGVSPSDDIYESQLDVVLSIILPVNVVTNTAEWTSSGSTPNALQSRQDAINNRRHVLHVNSYVDVETILCALHQVQLLTRH
jgi:hypothetical protein